MAAFFGMRGTGNFVENEMPETWREMILMMDPNGDAPLTAMQSMMPSEAADSPIVHWWEQLLPNQSGAVTDIYSNAALSTDISAKGTAANTTVYVKLAAAVAEEFRVDHTVLLRDESNPLVDVVGQVTGRQINGANSYLAVRLEEADDNDASGTDGLHTVDRIMIIGSAHPEGAARPDGVQYDPSEKYNNMQIFRTSVEITNTAAATHLRTGGNKWEQQRMQRLLHHGYEMEMAQFFGIRTSGVGSNNKPLRKMYGIIPWTKAFAASANVSDYRTVSNEFVASGAKWTAGGIDWIDYMLSVIFKYGSLEKIMYCGNLVPFYINQVVKAAGHSQFNFEPTTVSYGIKVVKWETTYGTLWIKRHPLFVREQSLNTVGVVVDPSNVRYRPLNTRDTHERPIAEGADGGIDGKVTEWLTECTQELHHADTFAYLTGFGTDRP